MKRKRRRRWGGKKDISKDLKAGSINIPSCCCFLFSFPSCRLQNDTEVIKLLAYILVVFWCVIMYNFFELFGVCPIFDQYSL